VAGEAASGWAASEEGRVRLVTTASSADGAALVHLGFEFDLAPGWKIYWRSPGSTGYPPAEAAGRGRSFHRRAFRFGRH
jgi:suppressor for copper-sensitivity B